MFAPGSAKVVDVLVLQLAGEPRSLDCPERLCKADKAVSRVSCTRSSAVLLSRTLWAGAHVGEMFVGLSRDYVEVAVH